MSFDQHPGGPQPLNPAPIPHPQPAHPGGPQPLNPAHNPQDSNN